jgi:hypothetical protein
LDPARLEALTAWIDGYRLIHEEQFRRLDVLLESIDGADGVPKARKEKK